MVAPAGRVQRHTVAGAAALPLDLSGYRLHPVQAGGGDALVQPREVGADWVSVPARTFAVFVRPR